MLATPIAAPSAPRDLLGAAQCAADQGRLAEAMALCERHNREHGPNATAFYLMALAADADGQPQLAQSYYRKTLYLDPTHQEALMQLAALLELGGDAAGAQRLYHRAQRSRNDHGG
jgi:chemotaxis protein methyltransferase WspC